MRVLAPPLDELSEKAGVYPAHLLPHRGHGLCLFAAGFLGVNDAIHMARQDMSVVCVDTDRNMLTHMQNMYPDQWAFIEWDAFDFAEKSRDEGVKWDVVSVDTWMGDLERRSLENLDLWCSLARKTVTLTIGVCSAPDPPAGWDVDFMLRHPVKKSSWMVLTRG